MLGDALLIQVNIVGIVQALFLALALQGLPGRPKQANRFLGLLLLAFALMFAYDVLYYQNLVLHHARPVFLRLPLLFLYGPLFWLYLKSIAAPAECRPAWKDGLHFLPFAAFLGFYLPALFLPEQALREVMNYPALQASLGEGFRPTALQQWLWIITAKWRMPLFVLQFGVYLLLCLRLQQAHARRVREQFSYTSRIDLAWVKFLVLAVAGLWLLVPLKEFLFRGSALGILLNELLVILQVAFVFLLGLFGLLQRRVDLPTPLAEADRKPLAESKKEKYAHSPLGPAQSREWLAAACTLMKTEKPFLDSELTLAGLAERLALPPRQLSQAINGGLGRNFLDFVNGFRIDEAKRYLEDPQERRSVLDIALLVGFNSKSAFYTAFKRQTGQTPKAYRQSRLDPAGPGTLAPPALKKAAEFES